MKLQDIQNHNCTNVARKVDKSITATSIRDYWREHNKKWAEVDLEIDADGLANVCHAGAPWYVNRYAAKCQEHIFNLFLKMIPIVRTKPKALDVGCGAARWSRQLSNAGYSVVGVDLQPGLIERNRKQYPHIEFIYSPIQEIKLSGFDLITSVTVIQHNPDSEQERIVCKLRDLLHTGGHVLIMENIVDRLPHVFAHDVEGWHALFERNGFRRLACRTYDYRWMQRMLHSRLRLHKVSPKRETSGDHTMSVRSVFKRTVVACDDTIEPCLVLLQVPGATHCAFLFEAI